MKFKLFRMKRSGFDWYRVFFNNRHSFISKSSPFLVILNLQSYAYLIMILGTLTFTLNLDLKMVKSFHKVIQK